MSYNQVSPAEAEFTPCQLSNMNFELYELEGTRSHVLRRGRAGLFVLSSGGDVLGTYYPDYPRFHELLDWNVDGVQEILIADAAGIFDGAGKQMVVFDEVPPKGGPSDETPFGRVADLNGNGKDDVIIFNHDTMTLYLNDTPSPKPRPRSAVSGPEVYNYSYY